MPDGSLSSDSSLIGSQAVEFFSSQFSSSGCVYNSELLQVIPSIITEDDNLKLCNIPDEKEILQAVKGLDPTSALMASQVVFMFTVGIFLKVKWWLLFKISLKEACSLEVSLLLHWFCCPTVKKPTEFAHMRPISLSSFASKIISRLLNDRLAVLSSSPLSFLRSKLALSEGEISMRMWL